MTPMRMTFLDSVGLHSASKVAVRYISGVMVCGIRRQMVTIISVEIYEAMLYDKNYILRRLCSSFS